MYYTTTLISSNRELARSSSRASTDRTKFTFNFFNPNKFRNGINRLVTARDYSVSNIHKVRATLIMYLLRPVYFIRADGLFGAVVSLGAVSLPTL